MFIAKFRRAILLGFIVSAFTSSAFAAEKLSGKDKAEIRRVKESYRVSWLNDEPEKILSLFAPDATIYPNGLSPRKGTDALRQFWFAPSDTVTKITAYELTVDEISGGHKLAIATGKTSLRWTMTNKKTGDAKRYESNGNYLSVFVKKKGKWLISKHIWNGRFGEIEE